ncbi:hypothetical protein ITP53_43890 [Nonomuraea sp. K274]|uniref:Uncharacterized protein n=1 Tax=Nonomuraea cypriaca TaxID=1187855 RepID=A0A931ALD6_9ACTN|nr:hypothetical protein [Nonomuraea cypriaca]MBF8192509.1 hypothetical protein [Nonomuraea cypriaca]
MIKRVCAAAAVVAVAGGGALLPVPAHADDWDDWSNRWSSNWSSNWSRNTGSTQSGNNFGDILAAIRGQHESTNVNNINGFTPVATHGGITVTYIFD